MRATVTLHAVPKPSALRDPFFACRVLSHELAEKLAAVNAVTRALREAGVRVTATSVADESLFIDREQAQTLADHFMPELRGIQCTTVGATTCNSVRLRGVRVSWLTPVKEQDK
ncbi:TPA: hypothetical protein ACSXXW_000945 [Pseudomonas aeruginosa]